MAEEARIPVASIGKTAQKQGGSSDLIDALRKHKSVELIFAVVGYAGSGTSAVAGKLKAVLEGLDRNPHIIKAREAIDEYAASTGKASPGSLSNPIEKITAYQNIGDNLREESNEYGAVAAYMVKKIRLIRQSGQGADSAETNAFIIDSLKHPAEVHLLRHVYGENFCLIGVGCRPDIRKTRLNRKLGAGDSAITELINRDAEDSSHDYGQQVNDTFHLSDFFVDNTASDEDQQKRYTLPDKLKRLLGILCDGKMHRPEHDERGLYHAHAASLRSSCLSRQVGASIMDNHGNLLSIGTNDVPRYQGGLYSDLDSDDDRCFRTRKACSNTKKQLETVGDIYKKLSDGGEGLLKPGVTLEQFSTAIKYTRIRALIEFSRSVHAEMDAILELSRKGTRLPEGATLYSTTYPCHSCARHIVAAGIERVVYLEPYSKSLAIDLHNDSIADNMSDEESVGKVRFRPYQGVSPRLYKMIYMKNGDLKDGSGNMLTPDKLRKNSTSLWTKSFTDFEDQIIDYISTKIEKRGGQNATGD